MLLPFLHRVADRGDLNPADAEQAMLAILGGDASTAQIAAFLVALRVKGETAGELLGFARAMRAKSQRVEIEGPLLDTCGTGGDGSGAKRKQCRRSQEHVAEAHRLISYSRPVTMKKKRQSSRGPSIALATDRSVEKPP